MRLTLSLAALLVVVAGPVAASPATDFFAAVRAQIEGGYYPKPGVDPKAIFDAAEARLTLACAPQGDACPLEIGVAEARQAVSALGDPHTRLEEPAPLVGAVVVGPAARLTPLGWMIKKERNGDAFYVAWVAPGGPAERAGVRRHDVLLAPVGMTAIGLTAMAERARHILSRNGRTYEVELAPQPGTFVPLPRLDQIGDIGVLQVPSGSGDGVAQATHDLIAQAQSQGARALILDLRDNSGGGVQCAAVASAFVDYSIVQTNLQAERRLLAVSPGRVRIVTDGSDEIEELVLERPTRWNGPLVVLVNDNTGSCSEAIAIQMSRQGRAKIVGEPSIGVGNNVVMTYPMDGGWRLVMTVAYSTTPQGEALPPRPVLDIQVTDDPVAIARTGRDPVLDAAVEALTGA